MEKRYPLKFVSYKEVRQNPKAALIAGKPPAERDLNVLIGANVEAGRIMAGVTFSTPGNWTSWPPHEHSKLSRGGLSFHRHAGAVVRSAVCLHRSAEAGAGPGCARGDCVLMPQGYHPNVAAPGGQINFLWMMAAIEKVRIDFTEW